MTNGELQNTLVLGIGNDILSDDGIGPKMINRILGEGKFAGVEMKNVFLGGLDILDLVRDYKKVIFIDAIKSQGGVPGSVYLFTPENFKETLHLSNFHDASFLTALELGKQLGMALPSEIYIIAIEIVEDLLFSDDFSPIIKSKQEDIYQEILVLLEGLIL